MFDITSDEISTLNDSDLRALIGRLCEAELIQKGYSPAAVTWGGNQTAPDGGFDVRVALPADVSIDGFIPRGVCGFQVKTPDMPRGAILDEMRPNNMIRPMIQELAHEAGAYIIVSSHGSTSDSALRNRRNAMREALDDVPNANQILVDFYDRTRLATWVRQYPGLITWVKERIGRALVGWHPYGPWCSATEDITNEYLLDKKLRLHLGMHRAKPAQSLTDAIDELRDILAQPGKIVRMVGLSGVGKTRLVQALFDARIGARPLPPFLAVYTNLSDNPDPQPMGLASDLIANCARAVLIIDNCPPDLHRRLSELCSGQISPISVLTVEYDVRDDQPENTHVVTLDTSSPELIKTLIEHRYPHISRIDAHTIADVSGGNARMAIGIAQTINHSDTIAGLSNDELFQRLFYQGHVPNDALLLAAQACSLVYSFQGETLTGETSEISRLASLAGQTPRETYRYVSELLRRDLVQERGVWRAVLPHAMANYLAARALEDIPFDLIDRYLISGGTERLIQSFSRRLSFLHNHPKAVAIVERWLAPNGLLGDTMALDHVRQAMFENVAPVLPEVALAALERAGVSSVDIYTRRWRQYPSLVRSLAYDAPLFVRSAQLLAHVATQATDNHEAKQISDTFISLFTISLSGTHATIEQRLSVIEMLLRSGEAKAQVLGLAAMNRILQTKSFVSHHPFEFGARSRNYGSRPKTDADVAHWYNTALALIEHLALVEGLLKPELRNLVARNFRGLWVQAQVHDELQRLSHEFVNDGFWREGWIACRETIQFEKGHMASEAASRLSILEAELKPSNLADHVRAVVLGDIGRLNMVDLDGEGDRVSAFNRTSAIARELGAVVATDDVVFAELLPDLLHGGRQTWAFGRGLAEASSDIRRTWVRLTDELEQIAPEQRNVHVLCGFLAEIWAGNRDLANHLLDSAAGHPALVMFLPILHTAVELDENGATRLKRALSAGLLPVGMCRSLAVGGTTARLAGEMLRDLMRLIADQADGLSVAVEILSARLYSDTSAQQRHEPALIEIGQELLRRVTFQGITQHQDDYDLAGIAKACLIGSNTPQIIIELLAWWRQVVVSDNTDSFANSHLLKALLELEPVVVLETLFGGDEEDQGEMVDRFTSLDNDSATPADAVSCEALIVWCERDRARRYPLAASFITFSHHQDAHTSPVWSKQAKALLTSAPDSKILLKVFIKRFCPMSWADSRAAVIEANAQLLGKLEEHVLSGNIAFVTKAKAELARKVAHMRQQETQEDRARDERFE